ncbi:MAG: hypothetical protein RTU92_11715 [Candidatus Thorarchaeota archaeon]
MNEHISIRITPSVVSEPDFVGPNGTGISPIKKLVAILIVSIAVCAIAMDLLADYMTPLAHVFWLFFHIFYIGGLVVYFVQKRKNLNTGRHNYVN